MTRALGLPLSDDVLALNPGLRAIHSIAVAKPDRALLSDGFDSQEERDFDVELKARGCETRPHGHTFNLPGGVTYTPDNIAWKYNHCEVTVYEVKGDMRQKNARDSRTRFRIAAGLYPCFRWVWVTRSRAGAWIEKRYR